MNLRAERIYRELLVPMTPGELLEHRRWQDIGDYGDLRSAQKRLMREHNRALDCERGVGYKLVAAPEHQRLQGKHSDRARRQLRTSRRLGKAALEHPDELTVEQAAYFHEQEVRLSQVEAAVKSLQKSDSAHWKVTSKLENQSSQQAQEIADLKATVAALAEKLNL